jgi:hypothetical protein
MFNLKDVKANSFDLLEPGQYIATITSADIKQSKAGNDYINLCFEIVAGASKGRKLFTMINHKHDNPQVTSIAMQTVKQIILAIKSSKEEFASEPELFAEIMHKPMMIKVGIEKNDIHGDKNIIKGYAIMKEETPLKASEVVPF